MHPDWQSDIMRYCEAHSSAEPSYLKELVRFTWLNTVNPRQLSGHLQGRLLSMFSFLLKPECVLEIGTFTGYSALCLAEGLAPNGILHSIEADAELAHKAQIQINASHFHSKIQLHHGNGLDIIPQLGIRPNIIFIDAAKQEYLAYFQTCLPLMASNGIMLFDNTLWSGKVVNPDTNDMDADTKCMHEFNEYLSKSDAVDVVMLPLRDGLTLVRAN